MPETERRDERQESTPQPPAILDYAVPTRPNDVGPGMVAIGIFLCALGILVGLVLMAFGIRGIWDTTLTSPAADKPGDYFETGLGTLIGAVIVFFSTRWLRDGVRRLSRRD